MKIPYILPLSCLLWIACSDPGNTPDTSPTSVPPPDAKHVEVLELSPTSFQDRIEITGIVEAKRDVIVSAKTTGTLEMVAALGQNVGTGQVVARTEDDLLRAGVSQARAQIKNAEARLKIAEDSYTRQQSLFADSIISPLEFTQLATNLEQAQSAVEQAEATHEQALHQLQYTAITAPIIGKVEARYVEVGERVVPGTELLRLVDVRNVQITAGVSERYAGDIEIGTPAVVSLPTASIPPRAGKVTFAGSIIDPASRSFEINMDVDNRDGRLKPEMIAELEIVRLTIDNALVIPGNAVTRTENGLTVFVVTEQDGNLVAQMQTVTLGAEYANQVVITDGVSAGEQVIIRGQSTLANDDRIIIDQHYNALNGSGVPVMKQTE